uniref:Uncharacterized protein n=1 Tax=viral metagenome TaxID=1070528 RepID=A0A6C0CGJ2_9ZZZZ
METTEEKLRHRIEVLKRYTTEGDHRLIDYVYETTQEKIDFAFAGVPEEGRPEELEIYLPESILTLVNFSKEEAGAELRTFKSIWQEYSGVGYERKSDSSPINILDVAIIWLSTGLNMEDKPPPFDILKKGAANVIVRGLMELLDIYIVPVVDFDHDTDAVFSKKLIVESAIQFNNRLRLGLRSQDINLRVLNLIGKNYLDPAAGLVDVPAFDDSLRTISYSMYLKKDEKVVTYVQSLEYAIFDAIRVNRFVPFCVSNMDEMKTGKNKFSSVGKRLFKAHATNEQDLQLYHKYGWLEAAESYSIILFVFIGDDIENSTAKDYVQVAYSYKKNTVRFNKLSVDLKTRNIDTLIERLNQSLSGGYQASLVEEETDFLVQEFIIPGLELDKDLFMHFLYTDVTAATLLRFKERENPWTLKKIIKFHAYLLGQTSIKILQEDVKTTTRLVKKNGVYDAIMEGDKVVVVTITARNFEQYDLLRFFTLKLFAKYAKEYNRLREFHNTFFNVERKRVEPLSELKKLTEEGEDFPNIKLLRYADPGVWWNANYARPIAPDPDLQVKPIRPEEISKYEAMGRDVIRWPVGVVNMKDEMQTLPSIDPATGGQLIVYYTTTTDAKPHITLVPNPGPNSKTHPLLPKCQASASDLLINKSKGWEITVYKPEVVKSIKEDLKTLKILDPGRSGPVFGSIMRYLQTDKIKRLGVRRSQSSFLHCLLYAIEWKTEEVSFRSIFTKPDADQVVENIRSLLGEYAIACMQENPDSTVEIVAADLINPNVFLDPSRHYRALEEMFKVGIFTAVANDDKELVIEAPPHKGFYTRSKRHHENDCILILKLEPQQSKVNRNYQCEIAGAISENITKYRFNEAVMNSLEKAVDFITRNIVVEPHCQALESGSQWRLVQTISTDLSTNTKIDLTDTFRESVMAQKLDSLYKLRAVKIRLVGDLGVWCLIQPLEPLAEKPLGEIEATSYSDVQTFIEKYGKKDLKYTPKDGQLAGVWTFIGELYVFIPVVPIPWSDSYTPVRFDVPYTPSTIETPTQEQSRLRRVMAVLLQVTKRLFIKFYLEHTRPEDRLNGTADSSVDEFFAQHVVVKESDQKMTVVGGSHLVPVEVEESFNSLLRHFIINFPTLFSEEKIRCSSYALHDNFFRRMRTFERVVQGEERALYEVVEKKGKFQKVYKTPTKVIGFPPYLEEFHVTDADFTTHGKNQKIFTSQDRYIAEMKMQVNAKSSLVRKIDAMFLDKRTPYFYLYEDDEVSCLYLVQNVTDGDSSRAATLSSYWQQNKVNLGYNCPNHVDPESVVQLQASKMKIVDPNAVMIVYYDGGKAAALLSMNTE